MNNISRMIEQLYTVSDRIWLNDYVFCLLLAADKTTRCTCMHTIRCRVVTRQSLNSLAEGRLVRAWVFHEQREYIEIGACFEPAIGVHNQLLTPHHMNGESERA